MATVSHYLNGKPYSDETVPAVATFNDKTALHVLRTDYDVANDCMDAEMCWLENLRPVEVELKGDTLTITLENGDVYTEVVELDK